MIRAIAALLVGLLLASAAPEPARVLVFSHTTGFRHDSIAPAIAALREIGRAEGYAIEASEDPARFDESLLRYDALVLLSATTDPKRPESEWLTGARCDAFQRFVRSGRGVVAIHAAADSHYHWPWYARMIGGRFARHPPGTPTATLTRHDANHPATAALPARFRRTDEWYVYDRFDPRVRLLLSFDAASIADGRGDRPVAWAHEFEGGRVFYTGLGHTVESWRDPLTRAHVAGGLRWALRR